jgi:prepilin-type N-terminal cleavage/methylation domain-containing protein
LSRANLSPSAGRPRRAQSSVEDFGLRVALGPRNSGFGFTLLEMLLALAVSAIVLAGIGGVFFSAIRLRERTLALVDESAPLFRALGFLRRDLQGALPPGGVMAGGFKVGSLNSGLGQAVGLQFTTTTGVLRDDVPWGDAQEVTYELRDPVVRTNGAGKDLIRSISRNLLSTASLDYNEQWLLGNVQSLEFSCFDGMNWRELWDTSITETNLPNAIRVRIQMVAEETVDVRNRQPIELLVPLVIQSRTNQTQQASGGGQ